LGIFLEASNEIGGWNDNLISNRNLNVILNSAATIQFAKSPCWILILCKGGKGIIDANFIALQVIEETSGMTLKGFNKIHHTLLVCHVLSLSSLHSLLCDTHNALFNLFTISLEFVTVSIHSSHIKFHHGLACVVNSTLSIENIWG
jgi:hypothetical protein